jgi:FAD/FMN-containing dehydrogenase
MRFTMFSRPSHCSWFSSHHEKLASQGVYQLINRREFLAGSAAFCLSSQLAFGAADDSQVVNDIHSQLNRTRVDRILRPKNVKELQVAVLTAKSTRKPLSIAGGRHAMGGQQFGTDMILADMTGLDQIVSFDTRRGLVEVQAGAFWPEFTTAYHTFSASKVRRGRAKLD